MSNAHVIKCLCVASLLMSKSEVFAIDDIPGQESLFQVLLHKFLWAKARKMFVKAEHECRVDPEFFNRRQPLFKRHEHRRGVGRPQELRGVREECQCN